MGREGRGRRDRAPSWRCQPLSDPGKERCQCVRGLGTHPALTFLNREVRAPRCQCAVARLEGWGWTQSPAKWGSHAGSDERHMLSR